jgi:hypothetical protein
VRPGAARAVQELWAPVEYPGLALDSGRVVGARREAAREVRLGRKALRVRRKWRVDYAAAGAGHEV